MDISSIIGFLIGVFMVIMGVYQVIAGRALGNDNKHADKYTPESYAKATRIFGIPVIVAGLGMVIKQAMDLGFVKLSFNPWLMYAFIFGVLIIGIILYYIILKKKDSADGEVKGSKEKKNKDKGNGGISGYGDD